jgi:hypothetical protein
VPQEEPATLETVSPNGQTSIRFRKGEKNDKELYLEVWTAMGFKSSLKVNEKMNKVYNDTVFGGISWSRDQNKIVFVGEVPENEKFKPYFRDPEEPKKEEEKTPPEEHWQDEKYLLKENFGETLESKLNPAIFIFDIAENKLNRVFLKC